MRPACGARQTPAVASRVRDNAARSDCEMKPVATGCITFTIVLALYASGQVRSHPANSSTASVTSRQPRSPGMLMPVMTHVARVIKTRSTAFTAQFRARLLRVHSAGNLRERWGAIADSAEPSSTAMVVNVLVPRPLKALPHPRRRRPNRSPRRRSPSRPPRSP